MNTEKGILVRIFIGESDKLEGIPLYEWIIIKAKEHKIKGATVLRGIAGFGAHSKIHTSKILRLSEDMPIIIEIIDTPQKIDSFLPTLDKKISEGLITTEEIKIHFYR